MRNTGNYIEAVYSRQFSFIGMQIEERLFKHPDSNSMKVVWSRAPFEKTMVDETPNPVVHKDFTIPEIEEDFPVDTTPLCFSRQRCVKAFLEHYKKLPMQTDMREAGVWDVSNELLEVYRAYSPVSSEEKR